VLLAADGTGTSEIVRRPGASKPAVILRKRRYAAGGIGGLGGRPRPGKPRTVADVAIVLATLEPPPERLAVTQWPPRLLAAELGISNVKIADVWREWGLQRQLHLGRRPDRRHQGLHRRVERPLPPLHLDPDR
jgi:hypothetical protein